MYEYDYQFKKIMSDNERFADLYNHTVLRDIAFIDLKTLRNEYTEEQIEIDGKLKVTVRDLIKRGVITFYSDGHKSVCYFGLEGKMESETAYVVRMKMRDSGIYERQLMEKKRRGKKKKLEPVINLGVCLRKGKWHAMRSLQERMDPKTVQRLKINGQEEIILMPDEMDDTIIRSMNTDVKELFLMIKYQDSPQKLSVIIQEDGFRHMRKDMAEAIMVFTTIRRGSPSLQ